MFVSVAVSIKNRLLRDGVVRPMIKIGVSLVSNPKAKDTQTVTLRLSQNLQLRTFDRYFWKCLVCGWVTGQCPVPLLIKHRCVRSFD